MSASKSSGAGAAFSFPDRPGAYGNYPHARRVGELLFISGMSCRQVDGSHATGIEAQTQALLENLQIIVARCGGSMGQLVDLTTFLINAEDFAGYNAVYNRWFDAESGPARTTVTVRALPHSDLLIEMKVVALISGS
jgi:2-aminomuconate deaminase